MRRGLFVAFGLLSAGATVFTWQAAQQTKQPPSAGQTATTFKSEIGVVEINAVVTDAAGNFARDLTKDDFQIYEDGHLRPFSLFSLVDVPTSSPVDAALPEPDVRALSDSETGRVYVLLLDDLHTAPLRTTLLKAAARRFIEQYFYPGDLAAVIYTGPGQGSGQELTGSRRFLLAAIDRFRGQQIDSAADGRLETFRTQQAGGNQSNSNDQSSGPLDDPNDAERTFNARRTLETLRKAAEWMADIQGRRKSLIFFSEGIDYDISDVFNAPGGSSVQADARDSIGAATRSNVSIYSVDPRGLAGLSDGFINLIEPQDTTRTGREQLGTRGIERDLHVMQDNLRMLSEETGGLALVNSNDFGRGFERIVRDNSTYYVLGYYTERDNKGGKFHTIDVRVRRPGLQVRARRGYVADPKAKPADPKAAPSVIMDALRSPVPAGNLPMRVFATSFKGDGKSASVVITAEIAGNMLKFQDRGGTFLDDIAFSAVAVGKSGTIEQTDNGTVSLAVKPDVRERLVQRGVRFLARIALPPARYQLRVVARESGADAASVVHYDIEVPDFTKEKLAMSGLLLTTPSAGQMATPRGDQRLQSVLPTPPTTERTFVSDDVIDVYAEIYDNVLDLSHGIDIVTTVKAADGRPAFSSHSEWLSEPSPSGRTFPYGVQVPLEGFAAGAYVLHVEARSRLDGSNVVREIPLRVK